MGSNNKGKTKERFIELRAQGLAYEAIATELGISRQTLQNWSKDLQAALENCKAIRLDALRAKYRLLQQHEVETFGELLERIKSELAKRDLGDVPTHRLMEMFLKCSTALAECAGPTVHSVHLLDPKTKQHIIVPSRLSADAKIIFSLFFLNTRRTTIVQ